MQSLNIGIVEMASLKRKPLPVAAFKARLCALEATHICFVDEGDALQEGALVSAQSFLEKSPCDIVQLPVYQSWNPAVRHGHARRFGQTPATFEPAKAGSKTPISLFGLVISKAVLEHLDLNDHAFEADGVEVVYKALAVCPQVGFAWSDAGYLKSRRTKISAYNRQERSTDQVEAAIDSLEAALEGRRPQANYQRALIAHGLLDCCSGAQPTDLFVEGALTPLGERVRDVARSLGAKYTLTGKGANLSFEQRALLFKLQRRSFTKELRSERFADFSMLPAKIGTISIKEGMLVIEALYWTFGASGLRLYAKADTGEIYEPVQTSAFNSSFDCTVGQWRLAKTNYSVYEVPIGAGVGVTLQWQEGPGSKLFQAPCSLTNARSRFALQDAAVPTTMEGVDVAFAGGRITAAPATIQTAQDFAAKLAKTTSYINQTYEVDATFRLHAQCEKRCLLLSDRPNQAGDNAYALFLHIMKNEPEELARNTFFAIRSTAVDFDQLEYRDHIVEFGSDRHKELFLNARWIFASHIDRAYFCPFSNDEFKYYADLVGYEFVWLQHGITMNDVSGVNNRFYTNIDYVVAATSSERDVYLEPSYFYRDENVLLTGFPRYDLLKDKSENLISVMPTWRRYLSNPADMHGERSAKPDFEESSFFQEWASVLSDPDLLASLEKFNYRLIFLTHPAFECYKPSFKRLESDHVIVDPSGETYRSLFEKSRLVITDYSSAVFDFAYLGKPIAYFQFDEEEFFTKHTKPGYFDYRRDGFGPVEETREPLISYIEACFLSGFKVDEAYKSRLKQQFALDKGENSARLLCVLNV